MMEKHPFSERIITGFFEGTLDPVEHHQVLEWLSTLSTEEQAEFMEIHWDAVQQINDADKAPYFGLLENRILQHKQHARRVKLQVLKIAAAVIPLIVISLLWRHQSAPTAVSPITLTKVTDTIQTVHIANVLTQNRLVKLPDLSVVTLYPGSEINYKADFKGKTREVSLVGKAFFNVKHIASKPFTVQTGSITTVVLGTSFWVNAAKRTISVKVKTGKVGVVHVGHPALFLLPSEKAVFNLASGVLAKVKQEQLKPVEAYTAVPATLAFNETPLKQVLGSLSENFNLKIVISGTLDTDLPISLNTKGKTIGEILESIKSQIPIEYEIDKKQIRIKQKP